ncbi:MAG: DNA-processing protein DprA [Candidatus Omnitrophica bacterium]|nr:DNA-processing protein DprA [Candidatus Omnitrophota bacterium]
MNVKEALILFNLACLSQQKINQLISYLKSTAQEKFNLNNLDFLTGQEKEKILKIQDTLFEEELKLIKNQNIEVIDLFSQKYPKLLKEISCPPIVLYVKGDAKILDDFLFAIVGTRLPTIYGLSIAEEFASKLASLGMIIVSGLARGIDTASHKGALKAGKTIAVLGSGLNNIYPKENIKLAEEISKKGAVVSEFPLKFPPLKENFPRRNRIISGLSKGVLIVEAREKSGALITASYALEQNREVFAIPGKIDSPFSKGTHFLIKEGAKLVESVSDILEELNFKFKFIQEEKNLKLSREEKIIFDIIDKEGIFLEEIIAKSKIERQLLNKILLGLQLKGLIREVKPSYFIRSS